MIIKEKQNFFLLVINSHGSLIFHKNLLRKEMRIDDLVNASSMFYSFNALSNSTLPEHVLNVQKDQIFQFQYQTENRVDTVVSDGFRLSCYHAVTGLKFVLVTAPSNSHEENLNILKQVYKIYSDHVSKDPNYLIDQPIKNKQFDKEICELLE
ncbi:hypothetical protein ABPG73_013377 [Tetrahymena malaccensis]